MTRTSEIYGNFIRFEIHNTKYYIIKHCVNQLLYFIKITIKITFPFFLPFEMYTYLR